MRKKLWLKCACDGYIEAERRASSELYARE